MTTTTPRDFFAVAQIGAGGSYARAAEPAKALVACAQIIADDWGSTFKLPPQITVALFEVTGNDEVRWDFDGVTGDNPEAKPTHLGAFPVTLPVRPTIDQKAARVTTALEQACEFAPTPAEREALRRLARQSPDLLGDVFDAMADAMRPEG